MPKGRHASSQARAVIAKFKGMVIGHSFFIADVERADMEWLRRPMMAEGVGIKMVRVECDEIYQQPGVRIWRQEGSYDEL